MFAKNRGMRNYVIFLFLCGLTGFMAGCSPTASSSGKSAREQTAEPKPISDDSLIAQTTREILTLFKDKKYEAIGQYVHPEKGVRFSPYPYVDAAKDVVVHQSTFKTWGRKKDQAIEWGAFDGTGDPIVLPFGKYAERFVYDADFLNAEETLINQSKGTGNTIDNREEVYKDKPYVCCYFSGLDPQYEGMDWRSLHLIYEVEDGKAWLIGVIHSEWTI